MQVHLGHDVTQTAKIHLVEPKHLFNECGNCNTFGQYRPAVLIGQVQYVFQLCIRNQDKPGDSGIAVQQYIRCRKPAQVVTIRQQLGVYVSLLHNDAPEGYSVTLDT